MNIFQQELQQRYDGLQVQSRYYVLDIAECAEGFAECGEFDKAHELAQQALQAARKRENEGSPMQFIGEDDYAECSVAIVHALSGQLDEALPRFFRVMNHAESRQITELHIKSLRWIGVCYVRISMCTTALEYLTKSRSYAEQHHDTRQESLACGAIGDAHFGLGDAQTALQYYREALRLLDISQQLTAEDTVRLKSSILFSLASAHKELGGVRQATVYFEQALAAYKFQGNVNGICLSLLGVADMYAGQERFDKALELLFAAFEVAEHHAGVIEQAQVNFAIGDVYRRAGRAEKALEYLRAAESLLDSSQRVSIVGKVHEALSATYKTLGDIPRAFHHLEIFHDIREQTALQDGKRSVKYLQQGFEMERAQKEAEIYRLKNVELTHAQQEVERLLLNILPVPIAQRLRQGEYRIADTYEAVTVVFIDLVGFTRLASRYSAVHIVGMLDHIFTEFDELTQKFGLEKIKTIGDAYMAVAGIPVQQAAHVHQAAGFALAVHALMNDVGRKYSVRARIGMHSGAAVAGVIGKSKFVYDLWGDTVNIASRMESHGEAGKIHISEEVYQALHKQNHSSLTIGNWFHTNTSQSRNNHQIPHEQSNKTFSFEARGEIDIKGKGLMRTWFLVPEQTEYSMDEVEELVEEKIMEE